MLCVVCCSLFGGCCVLLLVVANCVCFCCVVCFLSVTRSVLFMSVGSWCLVVVHCVLCLFLLVVVRQLLCVGCYVLCIE